VYDSPRDLLVGAGTMLRLIERCAGKGAFGPEELIVLATAFDRACEQVEKDRVCGFSSHAQEQTDPQHIRQAHHLV
jgi:hypothetical protein